MINAPLISCSQMAKLRILKEETMTNAKKKVCKHWKPKDEPTSYMNWFWWAEKFTRNHKQKYCDKCKLYFWKRAYK